MARFLADENTPGEAVFDARNAGFDVARIVELQPGAGAAFLVSVLSQPITWAGHFTVAREGSLRVIALR
jgi:hypothetical protein